MQKPCFKNTRELRSVRRVMTMSRQKAWSLCEIVKLYILVDGRLNKFLRKDVFSFGQTRCFNNNVPFPFLS